MIPYYSIGAKGNSRGFFKETLWHLGRKHRPSTVYSLVHESLAYLAYCFPGQIESACYLIVRQTIFTQSPYLTHLLRCKSPHRCLLRPFTEPLGSRSSQFDEPERDPC